jgi:hypothetical protein
MRDRSNQRRGATACGTAVARTESRSIGYCIAFSISRPHFPRNVAPGQ